MRQTHQPISRTTESQDGRRPKEPLLPLYLREMGTTSRIDGEQERLLAQRLQEARRDMARLVGRIPGRQRDLLLPEASARPPADDWPIAQIEAFHGNLVRSAHESASLEPILEAAKGIKRRLDTARQELILANLRLVVFLAKRHVSSGVPLMDLIQEGNIGLMRAVEKFDWELGHKFSTYAYWWIKQSIDRAISDKGHMIRIPVHLHEKRRRVLRLVGELRRELGRRPTTRELATRSGLPVSLVEELLAANHETYGFEDLGPDTADYLKTLEDPAASEDFDRIDMRTLRHRLIASLGQLTDREKRIIQLRYGLVEGEGLTLREVGQRVSLSRERVRQLEISALRKLQGSRHLVGVETLLQSMS